MFRDIPVGFRRFSPVKFIAYKALSKTVIDTADSENFRKKPKKIFFTGFNRFFIGLKVVPSRPKSETFTIEFYGSVSPMNGISAWGEMGQIPETPAEVQNCCQNGAYFWPQKKNSRFFDFFSLKPTKSMLTVTNMTIFLTINKYLRGI